MRSALRAALFVGVFVAVHLALGANEAGAQTFTWLPTGGGIFNTAANWSPAGGPPNAVGELALFDLTNTQAITLQTSLTLSGHRIENGNITYQLNQTTQSM